MTAAMASLAAVMVVVSARLRALGRTLREVAADARELEERRALLDRPWEEDFLHWVHDGDGWVLHGYLTPPRGRHTSVTTGGWCPGLRSRSTWER
jgi:hypothetical protein